MGPVVTGPVSPWVAVCARPASQNVWGVCVGKQEGGCHLTSAEGCYPVSGSLSVRGSPSVQNWRGDVGLGLRGRACVLRSHSPKTVWCPGRETAAVHKGTSSLTSFFRASWYPRNPTVVGAAVRWAGCRAALLSSRSRREPGAHSCRAAGPCCGPRVRPVPVQQGLYVCLTNPVPLPLPQKLDLIFLRLGARE